MSQYEAKVIRIAGIRKHENADTLEIVPVWGYTACTRIGDFQEGSLAIFVEPDTLVPVAEPEFAFLASDAKDGFVRIKAKRLRGIQSFGLLVHARPGMAEGDNVFEAMGLVHYEPPLVGPNTGGEQTSAPSGILAPKFDVEPLRKHNGVLVPGEPVQITEKIHGANARFVFHDGELHCGSHTTWKKRDPNNLWWKVAIEYGLEEKMAKYPDYVFYGEVFGQVQDLRYGVPRGAQNRLMFYDIMHNGEWLNTSVTWSIFDLLDLPPVPVLAVCPWSEDCYQYADGPSTVDGADNIREGCVVKPLVPRWDKSCGRVILKLVSVDYLGRKEKK